MPGSTLGTTPTRLPAIEPREAPAAARLCLLTSRSAFMQPHVAERAEVVDVFRRVVGRVVVAVVDVDVACRAALRAVGAQMSESAARLIAAGLVVAWRHDAGVTVAPFRAVTRILSWSLATFARVLWNGRGRLRSRVATFEAAVLSRLPFGGGFAISGWPDAAAHLSPAGLAVLHLSHMANISRMGEGPNG